MEVGLLYAEEARKERSMNCVDHEQNQWTESIDRIDTFQFNNETTKGTCVRCGLLSYPAKSCNISKFLIAIESQYLDTPYMS